jgi:hypothetical protein
VQESFDPSSESCIQICIDPHGNAFAPATAHPHLE